MRRISVAFNAFWFIITNNELSLNIKSREKELNFENGCYAKTTEFLNSLNEFGNVPDLILDQYKELLSDYTLKKSDEHTDWL
ncbi:MAG: hypothetical protein JWP67_606 [Mucilaginibacter sp.]|nr:hypothetical protein [Mucilaginibacter sp.]